MSNGTDVATKMLEAVMREADAKQPECAKDCRAHGAEHRMGQALGTCMITQLRQSEATHNAVIDLSETMKHNDEATGNTLIRLTQTVAELPTKMNGQTSISLGPLKIKSAHAEWAFRIAVVLGAFVVAGWIFIEMGKIRLEFRAQMHREHQVETLGKTP